MTLENARNPSVHKHPYTLIVLPRNVIVSTADGVSNGLEVWWLGRVTRATASPPLARFLFFTVSRFFRGKARKRQRFRQRRQGTRNARICILASFFVVRRTFGFSSRSSALLGDNVSRAGVSRVFRCERLYSQLRVAAPRVRPPSRLESRGWFHS